MLLLCLSQSFVAPWARSVHGRTSLLRMGDPNEVLKPERPSRDPARNVIGTPLECCCADVHGSGIGTGFFRDGFCSTGFQDEGRHTVCIEATEAFLAVSAAVGNPLHQAIPEYHFPGVRPGDCWCLCASRYAQLLELDANGGVRNQEGKRIEGFVPKIYLQATHEKTLEHVPLETLLERAIDGDDARVELARLNQLRKKMEKSVKL